jgi:hypothetical protein
MFMVSPRWVVVAEAIPRPAWRDEREGVRSRFVGGFYTAERYEAAPDCLAKAQRVETSLLNRFVTEQHRVEVSYSVAISATGLRL